jgi:hypothetical protein
VLDQQKFSVLKLNFAHFSQGDDEWREMIVELMKYLNVFADLSYCGVKRDFYDELKS